VTGMTVMLVGLVDHLDAVRRESILQLPCDIVFHQHVLRLAPLGAVRQRARRPSRAGFGAYEKIVKASEIYSARPGGLRNVKT
jgi:hypothetical protein